MYLKLLAVLCEVHLILDCCYVHTYLVLKSVSSGLIQQWNRLNSHLHFMQTCMQGVLEKVASILGQLCGPVVVASLLFQLFVRVLAALSVEPLVTEEESGKLGSVVVVVLLATQLMWQLR